ncbi:extracellular catalytic domain type 1 short-chain-length polyhydroxyalkanoate depolymerase [Halocatena halophila]|uniref:extracellular catalytic domain type 1 short-chain-length polyhydroxyalkanoate depolymerase n=1 Tax=Halocatena halophila TaxID=2814576 RepID=UPI002ED4D228
MESITVSGVRRREVLRAISGGVAGLTAFSEGTRAANGTYTRHSHDGLSYTKFVPDGLGGESPVPLIVMLHGCTQTADDFRTGTRMNEIATANDFIVIYPEQSTSRHVNRCWQWFNDENTTRSNGELATIAGMVEAVKSTHSIDGQRVYAVGFSAGGGMVPNLIVEYGDVFAGGAIHSGLEYDAVESQLEGTLAMTQCSGKDPQTAGTAAYDRLSALGVDDRLPTIVIHGTDDSTVAPCNGEQALEQALQTNDLLDTGADDNSVGGSPDEQLTDCSNSLCAEGARYTDSAGETVVGHWAVSGMGHAWSGGDAAGTYTAPGGPGASAIIWEFFVASAPGDTDDPSNSPPTASATVDRTTVMPDEIITFDGSASVDSDGSILSHEWTFPDDTTATGVSVTRSFSTPGERMVTLTVTDDDGATATDSVTVTVESASFEGYCGVASNYEHVRAGRAYTEGGYAYAVGSETKLGLYNSFYTTRLQETSDRYFEIVSSC